MGSFKCFGKDLREAKLLLGLIIVVAILLTAILGPFFAPHDPNDQSLVERRQLPNRENIFGRDAYGRDILSGVIYGTRVQLLQGLQ